MARNGSGVYTVPNTFNAGSTISSSDHNENFDDLGDEITNSVAADGQTSMTGPLKAQNGTAAAPALTFASDTDTGAYRSGANEYAIATEGVQRLLITTATATFSVPLVVPGTSNFVAISSANFVATSTFAGAVIMSATASFATGFIASATCTFAGELIASATATFTTQAKVAGNNVLTTGSTLSNGNMLTGSVVQISTSEYTTAGSLASQIPNDDTVPTSSEGTEILTLSHTPRSATNKLRVQVFGSGGLSGANNLIVAIFDGSTCKRTSMAAGGANELIAASCDVTYTPGDTSAHTISARIGADSGTFYTNGANSNRKLGGSMAWTLTVTEIKA